MIAEIEIKKNHLEMKRTPNRVQSVSVMLNCDHQGALWDHL